MNQQHPLTLNFFEKSSENFGAWDGLKLGMNAEEVKAYYDNKFSQYSYFGKTEKLVFSNHQSLGIHATLEGNALIRIHLSSSDGFTLQLQEIISKLGTPDYVLWDFYVEADWLYREAILYYPTHGLSFGMYFPIDSRTSEEWGIKASVDVCLQADTLTQWVDITYSGSIEELVRYNSQADLAYQMQYLKLLVPWRDYECVEVLPPSTGLVLEMLNTKNQ